MATYSDFLSLTLTALAVMLAVLAIFIGVLAIWGYSQITAMAERRADKQARKIIREALSEGGVLYEVVQASLDEGGQLNSIIRKRLGRSGDLFNALKEEVYSGIVQWESSGYDDPEEDPDIDEDSDGEEVER